LAIRVRRSPPQPRTERTWRALSAPKIGATRPRSRPPSPSPDRVRARPALPPEPAALFCLRVKPMFIGLLAVDWIDSGANRTRKQPFEVGKIRGLCSTSVRPPRPPRSSASGCSRRALTVPSGTTSSREVGQHGAGRPMSASPPKRRKADVPGGPVRGPITETTLGPCLRGKVV
jgi:hypothetical protein